MTSSTSRRCDPRFPAKGVLLDNSALVRLWKCEILHVLADTIELHVAQQVAAEFRKQGPSERAALERLGVSSHRVVPGSAYWDPFCRLRGPNHSTRDLGEDELLAICTTWASAGDHVPVATYDVAATNDAARAGVATLDFLDTLAWLVGCGRLTPEEADEAEVRAGRLDGWWRPATYPGHIEAVRATRQEALVRRMQSWRSGPVK